MEKIRTIHDKHKLRQFLIPDLELQKTNTIHKGKDARTCERIHFMKGIDEQMTARKEPIVSNTEIK